MTQDLRERLDADLERSQNLLRTEFKEKFTEGKNGFVATPLFKGHRQSQVIELLMDALDTRGTTYDDDLMAVLGMVVRGEFQMAQAACIRLMNVLADRHAELHGEAGV